MRKFAILTCACITLGGKAASADLVTVTSYDMNNGCGQTLCSAYLNYWDGNYTGSGSTTTDNAPLSGGLGALTDGVIATGPWYNVSNSAGTGEYVGWDTLIQANPLITFHVAGDPTVNSVNVFVDNSGYSVGAPATLTIDGVTYTPTVTSYMGLYAEELTVSGLSLTGSTITVQPNPGTEPWIFVSEVQFAGSAVPEPSTWAMMLIGFAGLGFVGYRRARKGAAVAG